MSFPIITVQPHSSTQLEQLGTKAKFWYQSDDGRQVLFKEGRPDTGENWAEKVCCEVARLLDVPHAEYELAVWNGKQGVISPSLMRTGERLVLGNELLARVYKVDALSTETPDKYKSTQHVLRRVVAVLQSSYIFTPRDWTRPASITNAARVFAGYLLLDALVGNQDRHDENWGMIYTPKLEIAEGAFVLAATFDHASSLGRNETDANRRARLITIDQGYSIGSYVTKARSGLFEKPVSVKAMGTLQAFVECSKLEPNASQYWLARLRAVSDSDFSDILNNIPDGFISSTAREFANAMLRINRIAFYH